MDLQMFSRYSMFSAERISDRKRVFGSLVFDSSYNTAPGLNLIPPIIVFHIVQYNTLDGKVNNRDDIVDPDTITVFLGIFDDDGNPVYIPLKPLIDFFEKNGRG